MLSVAESRYAIAYSSVIDLAAGVRAIPIAGAEGGPGVLPTRAEVSAGRYPLGRRLWLYTLTSETGELDPRVDRLLRFALSDAGQSIAESRGYWQLPPERRRRQLEALPAP